MCIDRGINKEDVVQIYNGILNYSAIKRNEIVSFTEMWMGLETVLQSEVSQRDKNRYNNINTYM